MGRPIRSTPDTRAFVDVNFRFARQLGRYLECSPERYLCRRASFKILLLAVLHQVQVAAPTGIGIGEHCSVGRHMDVAAIGALWR
jgi:hypothetical protein